MLPEINRVVDEHPALALAVEADLVREQMDPETEMSGEQVLRALIIGHINEYDNEELSFRVTDSLTFDSFCFCGAAPPSDETIQRSLRCVRDETWQRIHDTLLEQTEVWKKKFRDRPGKS
jgi:hypothetical protein